MVEFVGVFGAQFKYLLCSPCNNVIISGARKKSYEKKLNAEFIHAKFQLKIVKMSRTFIKLFLHNDRYE